MPGTKWSVFQWLARLYTFWDEARAPGDPFFMSHDMQGPYTYRKALQDLHWFLTQVSPGDQKYGLHGVRVEGYNQCRMSSGEDIATAHGLWKPGSQTRYQRWDLFAVFNIAAGMVEEDAPYEDVVQVARVEMRAHAPVGTVRRGRSPVRPVVPGGPVLAAHLVVDGDAARAPAQAGGLDGETLPAVEADAGGADIVEEVNAGGADIEEASGGDVGDMEEVGPVGSLAEVVEAEALGAAEATGVPLRSPARRSHSFNVSSRTRSRAGHAI